MYGSPDLGPGRQEVVSDYPIRVEIAFPTNPSRLFAVPLLGYLIRLVLLIPHLIALWLIGIVVVLSQLVLWAPVLFGGSYPRWGYSLVGGYVRWNIRVTAYTFGLTDRYPPFRLAN